MIDYVSLIIIIFGFKERILNTVIFFINSLLGSFIGAFIPYFFIVGNYLPNYNYLANAKTLSGS